MKKFIPCGLAMLLSLTMCGSSVFALEQNEVANNGGRITDSEIVGVEIPGEVMKPNYVATQVVRTGFSIRSGTAICSCKVTPKTATSITSIYGTFRIINGSGKTIKTYNQSMTKSNGSFYFSQNYSLPAKGTYYMKATLNCYKNGVKQETITTTSVKQKY